MNEIRTVEDQLRAEIDDLKKQLAQQKQNSSSEHGHQPGRPSPVALVLIALLVLGLTAAGFYFGYVPKQQRREVLAAESRAGAQSLPVVNVQVVERAETRNNLLLPGNIQAVSEAPVMARATGYIRKRNVDIGDRVQTGDVLAEIEAPELDQQIRQARAALDQLNNVVQQAEAALQQGRANANLARVTSQRWANLAARGVVSKQENDNYQAQYEAQQANVKALEKAVAAAQSNAGASDANLARLNQLKTYQSVRAPFAGVITVRNIDSGMLVNEGSTMLFRIAQPQQLRTYVNVPQVYAPSVRAGQLANLSVPDLPGHKFTGTVVRTANALDPASRTLLAEIHIKNPGPLMPGMYAQVDLALPRMDPPLIIPGDTLVVRPDGPQVAVVGPGDKVHFTRIQLGRDFGETLEVLSGLEEGQRLVVNPSDAVRERVQVKPVMSSEKPPQKR